MNWPTEPILAEILAQGQSFCLDFEIRSLSEAPSDDLLVQRADADFYGEQ